MRIIYLFLFLLLSILTANGQVTDKAKTKEVQSITFKISIEGAQLTDTLNMAYYEHAVNEQTPTTEKVLTLQNGYFYVKIDKVQHIGYVSLYKKVGNGAPMYYFRLYPAEPDDDIKVAITKDSIYRIGLMNAFTPIAFPYNYVAFSGKGAAKYQCCYERDRAVSSDTTRNRVDLKEPDSNNHYGATYLTSQTILKKYKGRINDSIYEILKVDYFSNAELERLFYIGMLGSSYVKDNASSKEQLIEYYAPIIDSCEKSFQPYTKIISAKYASLIATKELMLGKLVKKYTLWDRYISLKDKYPAGELRDKILTVFSITTYPKSELGEDILKDALLSVQTKYCLDMLNQFSIQNAKGKKAYDFSLPDTNGKLVKLSDFKGKLVFIDFWYTGCGGCASYYQKVLSIVEQKFKDNPGVVFVTINIDKNTEKWIDSVKSEKYTSRDVVNLNTDGKGSDHPIIKNYMVLAYPKPLLIDKDGKILMNNYEKLKSVDTITELINKALALSRILCK